MENEDIVIDEEYFIEGKIYTKSHIIWAAIFGGPIAVAYMFAQNFKIFGNTDLALRSWLVSIGIFAVIIGSTTFIPAIASIPSIVFTIMYAMLSNLFFRYFLLDKVNLHILKTGKTQSGGNVFIVILIGFIGIFVFLLLYLLLIDYEGCLLIWEEITGD